LNFKAEFQNLEGHIGKDLRNAGTYRNKTGRKTWRKKNVWKTQL